MRTILRYGYFIVLVALIATLFALIYNNSKTAVPNLNELVEGKMPPQAEDLSPFLEEVQFPLSQREGDVLVGINTAPVATDGIADWQITNPYGNQYVIHAEVLLQDGTRVFASGSIPPGSMLERGAINPDIKPGEYKATAYILSYSNLTYEYRGAFTVDLNLCVD